jgi:hypothetical protein
VGVFEVLGGLEEGDAGEGDSDGEGLGLGDEVGGGGGLGGRGEVGAVDRNRKVDEMSGDRHLGVGVIVCHFQSVHTWDLEDVSDSLFLLSVEGLSYVPLIDKKYSEFGRL